MTDLGKFFQEMLDSSPSITLFVEEILKYYNLASDTDKKFGAACIPKVASMLKSIDENFALESSDAYLDTPGSAVDRERRKRLADGISAISSKTNAAEFPNYTCVDAQISLSSFVREVMRQYFTPLLMGMSIIKQMVQRCKELGNPVDCANYLVGQILRQEFTYTSRPIPLSRLAALTLYYIAWFVEMRSGKYVTIIPKDDYDKLNISLAERFDKLGEVVLKLEE